MQMPSNLLLKMPIKITTSIVVAILLTSCANTSSKHQVVQSAGIGAAAGAVLGAIASKDSKMGALIGAATGAATGMVVGAAVNNTASQPANEQKSQSENPPTNTDSHKSKISDRYSNQSNLSDMPTDANRTDVRSDPKQLPDEQKILERRAQRTAWQKSKVDTEPVAQYTKAKPIVASCHTPLRDCQKIPLVLPKLD